MGGGDREEKRSLSGQDWDYQRRDIEDTVDVASPVESNQHFDGGSVGSTTPGVSRHDRRPVARGIDVLIIRCFCVSTTHLYRLHPVWPI